jgi:hypothetical protein
MTPREGDDTWHACDVVEVSLHQPYKTKKPVLLAHAPVFLTSKINQANGSTTNAGIFVFSLALARNLSAVINASLIVTSMSR